MVVILGSTLMRVSAVKKKVSIRNVSTSLTVRTIRRVRIIRIEEKPPHLWSSSAFLRTLRYLV